MIKDKFPYFEHEMVWVTSNSKFCNVGLMRSTASVTSLGLRLGLGVDFMTFATSSFN